MQLRDVKVVARFELWRLARSPHGLLFVALFIVFYGWIAMKMFDLTSALRGLEDPALRGALASDNTFLRLASWVTDLGEGTIRDLVVTHPPVLLGFFLVAMVVTPLFSMLVAFDQTASDLHSKHLRYLLLRTDRTSLYVGKALAVLLFWAGCMAIVCLGVGIVVLAAGGVDGGLVQAVLYAARMWLSLVFFAVPFVALLALINVLVGHGFLSLVIAVGLNLLIWAFAAIGGITSPHASKLSYAFPTAFKFRLVSDAPADLAAAVAHMGAFAVGFFALGLWTFRRRDV